MEYSGMVVVEGAVEAEAEAEVEAEVEEEAVKEKNMVEPSHRHDLDGRVAVI